MEWTCTECGSAAKADAAELLVHAGWWVTELRRGLCPACTRKAIDGSGAETVRRARALRDSAQETLRLVIQALTDDPYGAENTTRQ
jgi:hypothetical protein